MQGTNKTLSQLSKQLTEGQAGILLRLAEILIQPYDQISRHSDSDIVTPKLLSELGDYLRIHHCFSRQPFTKDKFEFALESCCNLSGLRAELAPAGNPGYDIIINGVRTSLKTQADKNIRKDTIHISKFMELGKGEWADNINDLKGLRDQFFEHMKSYERIFTLRCFNINLGNYYYELVEIPKKLLLEAKVGNFRMMHESKQMPKPGYCDVPDTDGSLKFQLYFDGGGERKLQIKSLKKDQCIVHAEWEFSVPVLQ